MNKCLVVGLSIKIEDNLCLLKFNKATFKQNESEYVGGCKVITHTHTF